MLFGFKIVFAVIQWIIALALIFRVKKTKLNNLYLLAFTLFLEGIGTMFLSGSLTILLIAFITLDIAVWSHLIFIKLTFYKDRKSPISILLALTIPVTIVHWILSGIYDIGLNTSFLLFFVARLLYSILTYISYGWMAYSLIKSYLKIRNNKMLEPWVKARYLLVITYVLGKLLIGILLPISPKDQLALDWSLMAMAFVSLIILVSQFLAWVMPEGLRKWLNRNFTVQVEEIFSEEELLKSLEGE